jgi:Resolvase, N terminal domain
MLTQRGISHEVLTAKNNEREAEIIAGSARLGAVTVIARMAGRGIDIVLGEPDATEAEREQVANVGGLCVLGAERFASRRLELHLRGRAGRQGDPGESELFASFEYDLYLVGRNHLGNVGLAGHGAGTLRSHNEQHEENEAAGEDHGFTVLGSKAYREPTGVSASRYSKKVRGDFERLIADLEHGRFGADVLVIWESSRGSRKVSERCHLIEACESAEVKIFVTTLDRMYNPANGRDRKSLFDDANYDEYESWKTSGRVGRSGAKRPEVPL